LTRPPDIKAVVGIETGRSEEGRRRLSGRKKRRKQEMKD
jgi:hypothetical protein